jgi:hypothetical protein
MQQVPTVVYQGRVIPKKGFRAWIYSLNSESKLVNSWDEYQTEISSGVWFSSKKDAEERKSQPVEIKPVSRKVYDK